MERFTQHISFKNNEIVNSARADILSVIDKICKENNLRYFGFGDLLVGAVHYNDFIPDGLKSSAQIGLLREEFEKFTKLMYQRADEYSICIIDRYKSGGKALSFTLSKPVVIEQEDVIIEDIATVEVCAFDYVPDSIAEQNYFIKKVKKSASKYEKIVNLLPPVTDVPMNLRKVFLLFIGSLLYGFRNGSKAYTKLIKTASKYKDTSNISNMLCKNNVILNLDDVFPTTRIKINKTEINIPKKINKWTVEIDDKLLKQTRTIQKIDLVLLKEFDTVCRKIGVSYFICGGTLLGYKRHGGFIPWDDDIDVGMLRADYDKFLKEGKKYLGEDFFLQTRKSDKKIPYLFSKVRMNKTSYITNYNELRDFHKGICLDLFPFDYVPNSLSERHRFVQKALFWSNVHFETVNRQLEKPVYKNKAKSAFEWWARTSAELKRIFIRLIPLKLTEFMYIKKATKYNKKAKELNLKTVASFLPTYTYADVEDIIPYQNINFEGVQVMALKDIDKFLQMQYGDYMQLPLLHNRVGHDLISWSIDDDIAKKYNIYDN